MSRTTSRRSRVPIALASLAIAMAGLGTASPARAATTCVTWSSGARVCAAPSTDFPGATGWYGFAGSRSCASSPLIAPDQPVCMMGIGRVPAWRLQNGAWLRTTLAPGTRTYVHPYAGAWRWVWTQRTGWLAINASALELTWRQ